MGKTTLLEIWAKEAKPLMMVFRQIWLGSFPRLVQQGAKTRDLFYRSYIQTYIQRDVQDVLKVSDQLEVDLLIESGDTLYPVEIKKTASPSQNVRSHFAVLNKLGKTIGPGAVLCMVERDIPLSQSVTAVPVGYL
ncbi:MAG: hypothetical protein PHQ58_21490 [Rhodoferax sp.]|nr:hypothetical protein [Rhodoferax sp.]